MQPITLTKTGLLVVDVQRGFTTLCPEELPVPGGLEIVPVVNRLLELAWPRIDATQDWHPANHNSFLGQKDNLYPPHCVMGSAGSDFIPGLHTHRFHTLWRKGFEPHLDGYSVVAEHPGLPALYRAEGIDTIVVCGLTTNICCFYASRDLRRAGFRVLLAEDAAAGIDVPAGGFCQLRTKEEGLGLGIEYVTAAEVTDGLKPR
jgi:nicotinamidase/pyrazinamidase